MSETDKSIEGFSPEQLELLQLRLARLNRGSTQPQRAQITPRPRESDTFPLSYAQQGYWFVEQLNPDSAARSIRTAVRIEGPLDAHALEQSLVGIVRRHEILRTVFREVDGEPVQVVSSNSALKLHLVDLSESPGGDEQSRLLSLLADDAQDHFDLRQWPLLRATLVRLGEEQHVLVLAIHHIICDKWSHGLFMRELMTFYHALTEGVSPVLPQLPIQYVDFAEWQREWLRGEEMEKQLAFWKRQLDGLPGALNFPTDHPRTASRRSRKHSLLFPKKLSEDVKALAQLEGTTLFVVLLAAFKALLYRFTEQEDIVVGSISANRNRPEVENLLGLFANTVMLRTRLSAESDFRGLVRQVKETTLEAHANQDLPFEKLVQEIQPRREPGRTPFFQVVFNLQKAPVPEMSLSSLTFSSIDLFQNQVDLDLFWLLEETTQGVAGVLEYDADIFEVETIDLLVSTYLEILQTAVRRPESKLSEFKLAEGLEAKVHAARMREEKQTIAVAATFTAEPLEETLDFWMQELDIPAQVKFAPYNQVFQQLLDGGSLLGQNNFGVNVVLLRLEDWYRNRDDALTGDGFHPQTEEEIERNARDFVRALQSAVARRSAPFLVCICPASPAALADPKRGAFIRQTEEMISSALENVAGVFLVSSVEAGALYPVSSYFDEVRDRAAHVSYTPDFFTALGTTVARKIHAMQRTPYKVVVMDCDQTLWGGVCAEDGVRGVEIDASRRALQEFIAARQTEGMLLCLCSKNNEGDVWDVFEQRPEMLLKREQVVASRINWVSKSENIKSLAQELRLGFESFIFIDDNPVECAEVEANCPGVLTIQFPSEAESIPRFLAHVWAFDRLKTTEEDRKRTNLYQQNVERERFRQSSLDFADFLAGLNLQLQISETTTPEVARVAQLTQRTNQFNANTVRRSEAEMQSLLMSDADVVLSVRVSDRFGDYGLVGVVAFKTHDEAVEVETFLLSCRVLGKGVEHQVVAHLGRIAQQRERAYLSFRYTPTERNQPVRSFLEELGADFQNTGDESYVVKIPSEVAASLTYRPPEASVEEDGIAPAGQSPVGRRDAPRREVSTAAGLHSRSALVQRIATDFDAAEKILLAIEARKRRSRGEVKEAYTAPRTPVEGMLAELWSATLGLDEVGVYDNFFKIGGHSLLGTLLISRIRDTFQIELPLLSLFEAPTVAGLADVIEQKLIQQVDAGTMAEMLEGLDQLSDEEVKALLADEGAQLTRDRTPELDG